MVFLWQLGQPFRAPNQTSGDPISLLRLAIDLDPDALRCLEARDLPAAALAPLQQRFSAGNREVSLKNMYFLV